MAKSLVLLGEMSALCRVGLGVDGLNMERARKESNLYRSDGPLSLLFCCVDDVYGRREILLRNDLGSLEPGLHSPLSCYPGTLRVVRSIIVDELKGTVNAATRTHRYCSPRPYRGFS